MAAARPSVGADHRRAGPLQVAVHAHIDAAAPHGNHHLAVRRGWGPAGLGEGAGRDSGGAGRFRGGLAVEREWRLLDAEAHLAIRSDRRIHLPYGLQGGQSGTPSTNLLHHAGRSEELPTMISTRMKAGERIYHRQPGGGGHGDPSGGAEVAGYVLPLDTDASPR